jgi:ribonuclease HI
MKDLYPVVTTTRRRSFAEPVVDQSVGNAQPQSARSSKRARAECTDNIKDFLKNCGPDVFVSFDGACRKGPNGPACASSVFVHSYQFPLSLGKEVDCTTNQQAEICGALLALNAVLQLAHVDSSKTFHVRGDSSYVIEHICSGRILAFDPRSLLPNAKFWNQVREVYQQILSSGSVIEVKWIPRRANAEADELCNACLDKRSPNTNIASPKSVLNADLATILPHVLTSIQAHKRRVIRTLPHELSTVWSTTLSSILANSLISLPIRRQLFLLAPHLLSCYSTHLHSSADFKSLRLHIASLRDATYLEQVVADLLLPQSSLEKAQHEEEKRIRVLASRGLFGRIVRDDDISVADPSTVHQSATQQLFPSAPLPQQLQLPSSHIIKMTFADVCAAARHLSRGKASGLSGWTRELFLPILHSPSPQLQAALSEIFTSIVNVAPLSLVEREVVTSSWLCLLQYKRKPGKLRPVCIRDFISKLIWTHLILNNKDTWCSVPGSSYRKRGGCAAVAQSLQAVLDADKYFVALDAENAFNTCSRSHVFDYVASRGNLYFDMFPFLNLFYAASTNIAVFAFSGALLYCITATCGAAQGCSSGPFFFHLCILHINRQFENAVVNVADDVYVIQPDVHCLVSILNLLARSGLKINISKCAIVGSAVNLKSRVIHSLLELLPSCLATSSPFTALGTILIPDNQLFISNREVLASSSLDSLCGKLKRKMQNLLALPTSLQIKFMTMRDMQFFCMYQLQATASTLVPDLCRALEYMFLSALSSLIGCDIPNDCHHLIYKPLEVGGLGFLPFADLCSGLRDNLQQYVAPILDGLQIPHCFSFTPSKSLFWLWRHITSTRAVASRQRSQDEISSFCWLSAWPNMNIRRFSDVEFKFVLFHLLHLLPPVSTVCIFRGATFDFAASTSAARHQHWFNCGRCGSAQFHHRHEAVLTELVSTAKYHNCTTIKYPANMPLPSKQRGGPDFLFLCTNNTLSGSTVVGDVAVTHAPRMSSVYAAKMRLYKQFSSTINGTTLPFVLNTLGSVSRKTIEVLQSIHLPSPLIRDLCINSACAMLKAVCASYYALSVRPADSEAAPINGLAIVDEMILDDDQCDT